MCRLPILTVLSTVVLTLAACGPPASTEETPGAAASSETSVAEEEAAVRAVLSKQMDAWNRFDLDEFMSSYWQSPELRFTSGGSVRRGWQETLERYRTTYPDQAAMGELSFEDLEVSILSDRWATVFGRYVLQRESDRPTGFFTLMFEKQDGVWLIVSDHTSTDD